MSIFTRRNALLGWIVWKLVKRRAKNAVPTWSREHPAVSAIGLSGALVALGLVAGLIGSDRKPSLEALR